MPRGEKELADGENERAGAEPQLSHRPTCRHPAFIAGQR